MNWDDLRILLAVNDLGTFHAAAVRLKMSETTVSRRLARLEQSLGISLFDAFNGTRQPTDHCISILRSAVEMERQATAIAANLPQDGTVAGHFRLATTSSLADGVLAPQITRFLSAHPQVRIEFLIAGRNVNFSRWEADFAVRFGMPAWGDFLVSKIADVRLFLIQPRGKTVDSEDLVVCRYPDELEGTPEYRYMEEHGLLQRAQFISENATNIAALLRSGKAVGVLPEYICRPMFDDDKLQVMEIPEKRPVWLLSQTHLKHAPAAQAIGDWIREAFHKAAL